MRICKKHFLYQNWKLCDFMTFNCVVKPNKQKLKLWSNEKWIFVWLTFLFDRNFCGCVDEKMSNFTKNVTKCHQSQITNIGSCPVGSLWFCHYSFCRLPRFKIKIFQPITTQLSNLECRAFLWLVEKCQVQSDICDSFWLPR